MKLLINLPTRGRPERALKLLDLYIENSTHNDIYFIISCDEDDQQMNNLQTIDEFQKRKNVKVIFNENKILVNNNGNIEKSNFTTKIAAINSGVKDQNFDICLLASDDMFPEIKGYDSIIVEHMQKYFPDTDGVLWYNDGYQADKLNTLCIFGKKYYDRFNYIYNPSYLSLYCDNEFTEVSKILKKVIYIDQIIIRHNHWSINNNEKCFKKDKIDEKNDIFAGYDQMIFEQRKFNRFYLK
jgi:hypothetical protein